ncbi:hypothetical protein QJS04_geneDACA015271 [Acorus gramineus]|uniref:Piriformospora indica-insensitive protein 2 n=1 Tax=Acorus gramineus TaxID=55184 RepID=A0AAV9APL3_ACOGR|nr:hypothetical protein QJS04_geneDACA015271 [Acorus gramineus]
MTSLSNLLHLHLLLLAWLLAASAESPEPRLSPSEQESAYLVLEAINPAIDWRSLYPDDLCFSGPHGVVCDLLVDEEEIHVTELSFGYLSDYSSNPPCGENPHFAPRISSFPFLRKLFFYNCFAGGPVYLPGYFWNLSSSLEELVFIENPSLIGHLSGEIGKYASLRRLVVSGSGISGNVPAEVGKLRALEQLVLSRSRFDGAIPASVGDLGRLRILDLSANRLGGELPAEIGGLGGLLKLDLSKNGLRGVIPDRLIGLREELEFLDLSDNRFEGGVPLFLAWMGRLRELHLSRNPLGGYVPEIWEGLGGILGIGFSGLGLVGKIPASMGAFLANLSYLGMEDNHLEGEVPIEWGRFEKNLKELNLENNRLNGRVPFSADFVARIGGKLRLSGNPGLCLAAETGNKSGNPQPVLFRSSLLASSTVSTSGGFHVSHRSFFTWSLCFFIYLLRF